MKVKIMVLRRCYSVTFVFIMASILVAATQAMALPSFEPVKKSFSRSDAVLLDRYGQVVGELRVDHKARRLDWVALKDVSPALIRQVLQSEDRQFYGHSGVNWKSFGAAMLENVFTGGSRGASTITMQVVSKLDFNLQPRGGKRSLAQKWDQIILARELERHWKKDEILEAYLNLIVFRGELQGIAAASRALFAKEPSGLNDSEAAILAALIRAPNAAAADVARRACALVNAGMPASVDTISQTAGLCLAIHAIAEERLSGAYSFKPGASLAPQLARVLLKNGLERVISSLDGRLQRYALESLQQQLIALKDQNVRDGAVLVVDNHSGEILAYVGNGGIFSSASYVDGVRAKRQAGSTLKPFIYEYAVEKKLITAATILEDAPLLVPTAMGLYAPQNYDNDYRGLVPVRAALASSLNIPAVRVLMLIGGDEAVRRLEQLGFKELRTAEDYGMSLALGSPDVTLMELVNAYRTIANSGIWSELSPLVREKSPERKKIMTPEGAYIISDILSDREARSLTFGFENYLSTRFWTAVKTGTSKDMRDNWCIGFSEHYTVGVWMGNFSGESMHNVSGVSGAAPVWLDVMNYLYSRKSSTAPLPPKGIVMAPVDGLAGFGAGKRTERFLSGTEPVVPRTPEISSFKRYLSARILYPASGTIIAIDPDIPAANARVFFEASRQPPDSVWQLNGQLIGEKGKSVSWKPKRGHYRLALLDASSKILDSIEFEVRGGE